MLTKNTPTISRPILRYHGGKWLLAKWIIEHFPSHRRYTEAFGGAASVLLQKRRSYSEVYNDLCGEVVNLFRVVRDKDKAEQLKEMLQLTPYSRAEFDLSYELANNEVEQARRTVVRSFMGFGSASHNTSHKTGFRSNSDRSGTTPAHDWMNYPGNLNAIVERLQGVVIENRKAIDVLTAHDSIDTLHYVDPPYVLNTRYNGDKTNCYNFEMNDDEHVQLAEILHSLNGMVVLSGYACELYDLELYADWKRVTRAAHADGARERVEVLWLNRAAARNLNTTLDLFN
ncbi:DNA adenine methylase [Pontibacter burrus]|uniref:DNA adenine methylase n=1 Tax=Pontibacter burrus TaxID=2704466 RepID=A0A6B3LRS7_9BACT|nr:DNA adenine methylase [Pontibacter burrus]NEM96180.1 DNA adenine methylase [Pontibacter burrus]